MPFTVSLEYVTDKRTFDNGKLHLYEEKKEKLIIS